MPKEYRERAKTVLKDKEFRIKILNPYDFVAKKYKLNSERIKEFVKNSIIFSFKRRIEIFLER